MARRLSWSDVRGGVIAVAALAAIAFAVLKFSRVGALHGDTFELYAHMAEARGVLVGSEVWLSGQKIGKIEDIAFRPPSTDTMSRIEIRMTILERYRPMLRRDATATIRNGGSFIGAPVVYMAPGTVAAGEMKNGDTVRTTPQADMENASSQFGEAAKEFPVIINNVKLLSAQLQATGGTVGALLNAPGGTGGAQLARARAQAARLMDRVSNGNGTVGLVMRGGLTARVQRVMARTDSIRTLLASDKTSFGRFRRDSTLLAEVGDIRNELSIVRAQLDSPSGTMGRAAHDSAMTNALADAERQMSLLFADLKKHPLRYIRF